MFPHFYWRRTSPEGRIQAKDNHQPQKEGFLSFLCLGLGVYGTLYLLETGILDEILVPSDEQYMSQALRDIENEMSEKNKKEH